MFNSLLIDFFSDNGYIVKELITKNAWPDETTEQVTYDRNTFYVQIKPKTEPIGNIHLKLLPTEDSEISYDICKL